MRNVKRHFLDAQYLVTMPMKNLISNNNLSFKQHLFFTNDQPCTKSFRRRFLKSIDSPLLKNITARLYRKNAVIASGSTADVIRYELKTGILLSPNGHSQKGKEICAALTKALQCGKLNEEDQKIAQYLREDLQDALLQEKSLTQSPRSPTKQ